MTSRKVLNHEVLSFNDLPVLPLKALASPYLPAKVFHSMRMKGALVAAFVLGLFLLYLWNQNQHRAYALRLTCWSIATDLLTTTNAQRVALIDSWCSSKFSALRAAQAEVEAVKLGDKPSDLFSFQQHATARLCFTNQKNKHFEIRIRDVRSVTNFQVIGISCD